MHISHSCQGRGAASTQDHDTTLAKKLEIPSDAWDSHMHVLEPDKFRLDDAAVYKPKVYRASQNIEFEASIGLTKAVLIQPSIYGHDNSCMLSALQQYGSIYQRAIVSFDPWSITASQLEKWHEMGVRGVRLNLSSTQAQMEADQLTQLLIRYADLIRPYSWVLQIYMPLGLLNVLKDVLPLLNVKVVLDHFGHPDFGNVMARQEGLESEASSTRSNEASSSIQTGNNRILSKQIMLDIESISGFPILLRLLERMNKPGSTSKLYVKLSAPYRLFPCAVGESSAPLFRWACSPVLDAYTMILLRENQANPCLVFATDWPHTRFEGLDIRPFVDDLKLWCYRVAEETFEQEVDSPRANVEERILGRAQLMMDNIFRNTAEELWDWKR